MELRIEHASQLMALGYQKEGCIVGGSVVMQQHQQNQKQQQQQQQKHRRQGHRLRHRRRSALLTMTMMILVASLWSPLTFWNFARLFILVHFGNNIKNNSTRLEEDPSFQIIQETLAMKNPLLHPLFSTATLAQKQKPSLSLSGGDEQSARSISSINKTSLVFFDARFENGTLGYVANPKELQRGLQRFVLLQKQEQPHYQQKQHGNNSHHHVYWHVLENYQQQQQRRRHDEFLLGLEYTCSFSPGRGLEEEGGYKLLTEKIRIDTSHDNNVAIAWEAEHQTTETHPNNNNSNKPVRLFCAIYTHQGMHDLARVAALSWGWKCDGFLAFSDETTWPLLGIVNLVHVGEESYQNMWQKTRSIWAYIYTHYLHDYDYFHLGGDDMYVIPENLKRFLSSSIVNSGAAASKQRNSQAPLFAGQLVPGAGGKKPFISGGPGYTLNRQALRLLVEQALPQCHVHMKASYEDRLITECLKKVGVLPVDTRDAKTGQQLYHDCTPHCLYTTKASSSLTSLRGSFHSKAAAFWEKQLHPNAELHWNQTTVGRQEGLASAATYSVSFHNIYHPLFMTRVHAILHPQTCPANSQLGKALRSLSRRVD